MAENKRLSQSEIQAIADALGDTNIGLTGTEIGKLLPVARMSDPSPSLSKRDRLLNAFADCQSKLGHRKNILQFIREAMAPANHTRHPARYEPLRARLNVGLAFAGLAVDEGGKLIPVSAVATLTEAQRRAAELRKDLVDRDIHPDVLACCREECLVEDYFHAIFEATKSIAVKLRDRTGLQLDGSSLIEQALGGDEPILIINAFTTQSERSEQRGFVSLLKGLFGLFRNPMAHEARVRWASKRRDAEEVLTMTSLAHRRLDQAVRR